MCETVTSLSRAQTTRFQQDCPADAKSSTHSTDVASREASQKLSDSTRLGMETTHATMMPIQILDFEATLRISMD
eukprot:1630546-Amphidinium_carterae.1